MKFSTFPQRLLQSKYDTRIWCEKTLFVQPGEKEIRDFIISLAIQGKIMEKIQPNNTVCINRNSGYLLGNKYFHCEGSQTLGQVAQRRYGIFIFWVYSNLGWYDSGQHNPTLKLVLSLKLALC